MGELTAIRAGLDQPTRAQPAGAGLIRGGADLVELAEGLYVRLFHLAVGSVIGVSLLSIVLSTATADEDQVWLTTTLAGATMLTGLCVLVVDLAGAKVYLWLRHRPYRQLLPALVGMALLAAAPHGPLWFVALGGIAMTAVVGSFRVTLVGAFAAAAGYLAGFWIGGESVFFNEDPRLLGELLGLPVIGLLVYATVAWLGGFVLRLHRFEVNEASRLPPRVTPNLASRLPTRQTAQAAADEPKGPGEATEGARSGLPLTILTSRQIQVLLLVRDGLHQGEIAACLSISSRQVERLLGQARKRAAAATTGELVAMLIRAQLAPPLTRP